MRDAFKVPKVQSADACQTAQHWGDGAHKRATVNISYVRDVARAPRRYPNFEMASRALLTMLPLMFGRARDVGQGMLLAMGCLLAACSNDDPGGTPANGGSGSDGTGLPADGANMGNATCAERPLFVAEPHGDSGNDMVRGIQVDEATGKLIFSDLGQMFEVPLSGGKPSLLGARPNDDIAGDFWLSGEEILYPAGFATPAIEEQQAVLFSTDRDVKNQKVAVGIPASDSLEWRYEVADVQVAGDNVYWLARDKHTDRPADLLPEWDTTYAVRRTSWRTPTKPEDVYSTKSELTDLVVAGQLAFVAEETEPDSNQPEHRIIDLKTNTVLDQSTEAKFGGQVVAGDDTSLFVTKLQLEAPYEIGVFRVAPDGSGAALLSKNPFVSNFTQRGDTWLFTDSQSLSDPNLVFSYQVGAAPKQIGCIDSSATIHALASSATDAYVGIFRDNTTTILEFAR